MKNKWILLMLSITILLSSIGFVYVGYTLGYENGIEEGKNEGAIVGANYGINAVAYNLCEENKTFSCEDNRVCGCFNLIQGDTNEMGS